MNTIENLIKNEEEYQRSTIRLIASENTISPKVASVLSSVLSNRYSEGYPGRKYYNGQKYLDSIEDYVRDKAKEVFNMKYANVQPYSGSPANLAIYMALVKSNEYILSLSLSMGGHLTHGSPVSMTGKYFKFIHYHLNDNGEINYDEVERLTKEYKPKMIVAGCSSYSLEIDFKRFANIASQYNSLFMADISHIAGLIVGGYHTSPSQYADIIMTTTHKSLRGPKGALILSNDLEISKKIDRTVFPGIQGGSHLSNIASIGLSLEECLKPSYKDYCKRIINNASTFTDLLLNKGYKLVSDKTENHTIVIDLRPLKLNGKRIANALEEINIIVNANSIPHDTASLLEPSGIRLGTVVLATRGIKSDCISKIVNWIDLTIKSIIDNSFNLIKDQLRKEVIEFISQYELFVE